jgi:hypothetical protein
VEIEEAAARMETLERRGGERMENRGVVPMEDGRRGREDGDGPAADGS